MAECMAGAKASGDPWPTADLVSWLTARYEEYAGELKSAANKQRALLVENPSLRAQLDDIEAEITYLLIREFRPAAVVEIGCLHGWSTSWILRALSDNGGGRLHSFDMNDTVTRMVPPALADGRWTFVGGDVRRHRARLPADIDYLFIDAAHSARFARWYIRNLFPVLAPGTPVSVHDVFHRSRPLPFTEGSVLLNWLRRDDHGYFTASPARARPVYERLRRLRAEIGIADIRAGTRNPMLFFTI
jgi:predicted O-methyltransferase YrrM